MSDASPSGWNLTAEQVNSALDTAKGVGAGVYLETARAFAADGHTIPTEHQVAIGSLPDSATPPAEPPQPAAEDDREPSGWNLTTAQVERMVAWLRAAGVADDRIAEALAEDGIANVEPDTRTPEQIEHDGSYGLGARYEPEQYYLRYPQLSADMIGELPALNNAAREFFSALQLQPALARGLLSMAFEIGAKDSAMTAPERELELRSQAYKISKDFPGEKYAAANKAIDQMLTTLAGDNEFAQVLRERRLLEHAWMFKTLATHAELLAEWATTRPKGTASRKGGQR